MPMRGLYELKRLVAAMREKLHQIDCPIQLLQGSRDPVVVPGSMESLQESLSSSHVEAHWIESAVHGIAYADVDNTWDKIINFANRLKVQA